MDRKYYFYCSPDIWCVTDSPDYNRQKESFSQIAYFLKVKWRKESFCFEKEIEGEPPLCLQNNGTLLHFNLQKQKGKERLFFNAEVAGHEVTYSDNQEKIYICLKLSYNDFGLMETFADWFHNEWKYLM